MRWFVRGGRGRFFQDEDRMRRHSAVPWPVQEQVFRG
ncbi:hypothetical protein H4W32_001606 [Actinophytocola algeriensis]|uniref:Uncharacterized protein n=1 Tax=Actinophytocola algeriensis TaxID=1768010 RepID=A0A7W7QFU7_9PSEU|nr:hypothetical protein [Actinophytocola algeriensis]MBE1473564.1 hypothetical protein [Actinophytocola algeriensis]